MRATMLTAVLVFLVATCSARTDQRIRSKATVDIRCPKDQLKLFHTDRDTYTVVGCGQSVEYERKCRSAGGYGARKCSWKALGERR